MDLHTLIATHKNGRSYQALADASGGTIGQKAFQGIATRPTKAFPGPDTIRGLATALQVTEQTVLFAIAESLNLCQPDPKTPRPPRHPAQLEEEHTKLLHKLHHLQEQTYYWQNHAATYRIQARTLRHHFNNLQPIAQDRPWLIAGTQHQADHMNTNESR